MSLNDPSPLAILESALQALTSATEALNKDLHNEHWCERCKEAVGRGEPHKPECLNQNVLALIDSATQNLGKVRMAGFNHPARHQGSNPYGVVGRLQDGTFQWAIPNESYAVPAELLRGTYDLYVVDSDRQVQGLMMLTLEQQQKLDAMRSRISTLETALRFYANQERYRGPNKPNLHDDEFTPKDNPYIQDVTRDQGDLARKALLDKDLTSPPAVTVEPVAERVNGTLTPLKTGVSLSDAELTSLMYDLNALPECSPDQSRLVQLCRAVESITLKRLACHTLPNSVAIPTTEG